MESPEVTGRRAPPDPVEQAEAGPDALAGGARAARELAGTPVGFGEPVGSLVTRAPLMLDPAATVADAARAMRGASTGAALVDDEPPGIVTDRDLRNRVVAERLGPETPARKVMSRPLVTLGADAPLHEALLLMLDRDIHHVPVLRGGRIVGIVSDKQLLRRQARGPLLLMERIKSLDRMAALEGYSLEIAATAGAMLSEDVEPVRIARVIASLNDTLTGKLLRLAEEATGPPPCPYTWLELGSGGRMEQVLTTDQDNALAYAEDTRAAHAYFEKLAGKVVEGLLQAGFPPCPGGYMATRWRRPLAVWEQTFRAWIGRPEPQALLEAEVFLDFRAAHGDLSLAPLDGILHEAAHQPLFLSHMARAALRFRPPLGLFGRLRAELGRVDLKLGGLAALVLLARLVSLASRSPARSTVDRLRAGAEAGVIGHETAEALIDAFRLLMRLRLREQLRSLAAGSEPGNAVPLDTLTSLEQRRLREALRTVAEAQRAVGMRYHAAPE